MLINSANVVGVGVAFVISRFIKDTDLRLERGVSMFYIVFLSLAAAASSASIGGVATIVVFHSHNGWTDGAIKWFADEFTNYATLLPVTLTFPFFGSPRPRSSQRLGSQRVWGLLGVLAALITLSWYLGGASSVGFTMPALVFAGLTTNVFVTSVFCAISTLAMLALHLKAAQLGVFPVSSSVQIGLSLLAIGPVAVASTMRQRDVIDRALVTAMTTDDLTSALRRAEFLRRAEIAIRTAHAARQPIALLMMDLDLFKRHNDTHGHQVGDDTLIEFTRIARSALSNEDLLARLGGEEFVALLPGANPQLATHKAQAIRTAQEHYATTIFGQGGPTVSIGIATHTYEAPMLYKLLATTSDAYIQEPTTISKLLAAADAAVYAAKCTRNTIVTTANPPIPLGYR
ncbi:GGDEF domain-containing protein [Mycobacterium sp. MAA66]|uniref:GGDEF domain-containing protein n=1 Tax=Mycobacterium sp. MAA66 TaxID=3156297 RepID=UPI00351234A1